MTVRIPYLQHIGAGLHIGASALRWVELTRTGDRVRVKCMEEGRLDPDRLEDSLVDFIRNINPSRPFVASNLDPDTVRVQTVPVPAVEDPGELNRWLQMQKSLQIPQGLPVQDFVITHHFLEDEQNRQCLLLMVRRSSVMERVALLEKAGLKPLVLTDERFMAGYSMLYDGDFVDGWSHLLHLTEPAASLVTYQDGLVAGFRTIEMPGLTSGDWSQELQAHLAVQHASGNPDPATEKIYPIDEQWRSDVPRDPDREVFPIAFRTAVPLSGVGDLSDEEPDASFCVATGLSVRHLFPSLDSLNLLPDEIESANRERHDREEALSTGIWLGGATVLVYLLILIAGFFVGAQLEEANDRVRGLDGRIAAVEEAAEQLEDWEGRVREVQSLLDQRTNVALVMEQIAKQNTEQTWFTNMQSIQGSDGYDVSLAGFSRTEQGVALLMKNLEEVPNIRNVRLVISEQVESGDRYDNLAQASIVRFEIRLRSARGGEG